MQESSFRFAAVAARRIPDPNFRKSHNMERYVLVMPVHGLPPGLPFDPNARRPNIRKRVYQEVQKSLLNQDCEPNTFHLKNKGITIVADSVKQMGDNEYLVGMKERVHGIVDGGHTYELIIKNQGTSELPTEQFVNVEIRVGVPDAWIPEIAGGLNTAVQVQDMSLDNLAGMFGWIQDELKGEPYRNSIAWRENDQGDFDARDLVSLLTMFNVALYPNDKDEHPVQAYEKKSAALKLFEQNARTYEEMRSMLKDILKLHDIIGSEARHIWNKATGGKAGNLSFMVGKKKGVFEFPFLGTTGEYRLETGALYPILAAFRWYVERDPITLKMRWRDGFKAIVNTWRKIAPELLKATLQTSNELGRNPNALGKSRNHWANLHTRVAKYDLLSRQATQAQDGA